MIEILVYPAKEVVKEIDGLMDNFKELELQKDKEVERLKKEKEWLEYKVLEASQKQYPELSYAERVAMLEDDMQQALKEE